MDQIHASCVAVDGKGILLRGPSGGGKSDLALRLIDRGAVLVADDRVDLAAENGSLFAAPPRLAGLLEVREVGILRFDHLDRAPVALVVDLVARGEAPRLPEPAAVDILGVSLSRFRLDPFAASAAMKVSLALANPAGGIIEA